MIFSLFTDGKKEHILHFIKNVIWMLMYFSGAGRATADAFLRLIYKKPVASRPVLDLSLHDVRDGFMDLILDAATGLERKSWRSVIRSNKYLRFRKFLFFIGDKMLILT